jgi:hypothetical protein
VVSRSLAKCSEPKSNKRPGAQHPPTTKANIGNPATETTTRFFGAIRGEESTIQQAISKPTSLVPATRRATDCTMSQSTDCPSKMVASNVGRSYRILVNGSHRSSQLKDCTYLEFLGCLIRLHGLETGSDPSYTSQEDSVYVFYTNKRLRIRYW